MAILLPWFLVVWLYRKAANVMYKCLASLLSACRNVLLLSHGLVALCFELFITQVLHHVYSWLKIMHAAFSVLANLVLAESSVSIAHNLPPPFFFHFFVL